MTKNDKPQPTQQQVDNFLDWLRGTGTTNMLEAVPFIQKQYNVTKYDASRFLVNWMSTFGERHSGQGGTV